MTRVSERISASRGLVSFSARKTGLTALPCRRVFAGSEMKRASLFAEFGAWALSYWVVRHFLQLPLLLIVQNRIT